MCVGLISFILLTAWYLFMQCLTSSWNFVLSIKTIHSLLDICSLPMNRTRVNLNACGPKFSWICFTRFLSSSFMFIRLIISRNTWGPGWQRETLLFISFCSSSSVNSVVKNPWVSMTETILSSTLPLCISLTLVLVPLKAFLPSIKFPVALFPTPEAPSSTILSSGKWNVFSDSAWRYKTVTQMWPFLKWELQYFSYTSYYLCDKCEGLVQQCREDYVLPIKVALSYSQVQINSKFTLHTYNIMGFEKWKPFSIEMLGHKLYLTVPSCKHDHIAKRNLKIFFLLFIYDEFIFKITAPF